MIEVLSSLIYSVIGFALGWFAGRQARNIEQIHHAVVHEGDKDAKVKRPRGPVLTQELGVVMIIIAIVIVAQASIFTYKQHQATECLAHHNSQFAQDRGAFVEFFRTYQDRKATREDRARAFDMLAQSFEKNSKTFDELERCE